MLLTTTNQIFFAIFQHYPSWRFKKLLMKGKISTKAQKSLLLTVAITAGLLSLLAIYFGLRWFGNSKEDNSLSEISSVEETRVNAVSALGRLEPLGEVINVAATPSLGGAKLEQLLVAEGDQVKAGQLIAVLDNDKLRRQDVRLAQKEVEVAQANLNTVKAGAKQGAIKAQEAEIERIQVELSGEKLRNSAKIRRLEAEISGEQQSRTATIDRLSAEVANAEREFRRNEQLATNGAISESDLDARLLTLETSREALTEAQAQLIKTLATLNAELNETKADNQKIEATLEKQLNSSIAELDRITEVRDVDVAQAQAEVNRAKAILEQAKEEWQLTKIYAPFAGQILKINTYPGENVDGSEGVVELGRTEQMIAIAEVYENDISKIKIGQKALVNSENQTFSETLEGSVMQIGLQIGKKDILESDPAADIDARVIEVKIRLEPSSSQRVRSLTNAKVIVKILT